MMINNAKQLQITKTEFVVYNKILTFVGFCRKIIKNSNRHGALARNIILVTFKMTF